MGGRLHAANETMYAIEFQNLHDAYSAAWWFFKPASALPFPEVALRAIRREAGDFVGIF